MRHFTWQRVVIWLRREHRRSNWQQLRWRYLPGWWPTDGEVTRCDIGNVAVTGYRYRGTKIPDEPTGNTM